MAGIVRPVGPAIPAGDVDFNRCKVAFVRNASELAAVAVHFADRDGNRAARYGIAPTTTDPRGYAPLVVEYDADEDRLQVQLTEPRGSLVCVVAERGGDRTAARNPTASASRRDSTRRRRPGSRSATGPRSSATG